MNVRTQYTQSNSHTCTVPGIPFPLSLILRLYSVDDKTSLGSLAKCLKFLPPVSPLKVVLV
jgi:hypothetical protein